MSRAQTETATSRTAGKPRRLTMRLLEIWLNLMASIHVVWFYINRVPSYLNLGKYELGQERMPFQARVLLMYPLRWAHDSSWLHRLATALSTMYAWFPKGIRPEGILEAAVDLACVAVAGLVARRIYRAASPTGVLLPVIYPLVLVMITGSYCLLTMHFFRYIYDLPSLGFFSLGLYIIYFRKPVWIFACVFVLATLNRETSLFLLAFLAADLIASPVVATLQDRLRLLLKPRAALTFVPLALFWVGWHLYVQHHFRTNPSESLPRLVANIFLLLWPLVWPQLFGAAGYLFSLILLFWTTVDDRRLRAWRWVVPCWIAFMMVFGIILEIRLLGELIPVFVCVAALAAEKRVSAFILQESPTPESL